MFGRGLLRYARWAKRFLTFAELPEEPRFRRSYTLYDPEELAALVSPELAGHIDRLIEEHSEIYHDNSLQDEVNRMCLADARLFLPGLNLAYTDRASMAASPSRCGCHSSIPSSRGPRSPSGVVTRSGAGRARSRSSRPPRAGCRVRSYTGPRHPSACRYGRGYGMTCSPFINDVADGRGAKAQITQGMTPGRWAAAPGPRTSRPAEDRAKQIWQLLTLELWYRNVRSAGVAALTEEDAMKQIAQNYKSGELVVLDAPAPPAVPGASLYSHCSRSSPLARR